jgi:transcriptional regulator with XRE-family HTH domain
MVPGGDLHTMSNRGERMMKAMQARGLTKQHALAHALGVNESTITRWKNDGPMAVDSAVLLCKELDISLDWFLNGTGAMDAHKSAAAQAGPSESRLLASFRRVEAAMSDRSKLLLIAFVDSIVPEQRRI